MWLINYGVRVCGQEKWAMLLSATFLAATYMPTCLVISNRLFAHHKESIQMDIKPFPSLKNIVTHITRRSVLSTSFS